MNVFKLKYREKKVKENKIIYINKYIKKQSFGDLWDIIRWFNIDEVEFLGLEWEEEQRKYI